MRTLASLVPTTVLALALAACGSSPGGPGGTGGEGGALASGGKGGSGDGAGEVSGEGGALASGGGEGGEANAASDVLVIPPGEELISGTGLGQAGGTQIVYVNFDGVTVSDCKGYCSDAATNRSFAIGAHFGVSELAFPPYADQVGRNVVLEKLKAAFAPYNVSFTTQRPASPPYTMLVVAPEAPGPAGGVAPLDCVNKNVNDIAFVYKAGKSSHAWVAQASAHELGHSFGLDHVTAGGDFMHWQASGSQFTVASYDHAHGSGKACLSSDTQDAPAMLAEALSFVPFPCPEVDRIAGAERFETAALISKRIYPDGAPVAVLTKGADLAPDALAAGPLAKKLGGPLLLTNTDALPEATSKELSRLGVSKVVLIGGETAISKSIELALVAKGILVERIAGASRYDTAARVAKKMGPPPGGLAFVASGENAHLIDALATSGPAAALGAPVLLVSHGAVPAETAEALAALGIKRTIVAGGQSAVSDAVLSQLPSPSRAAGASRFDTAVAVAEAAMANGVGANHVFVGRGDKMPDALAAGAAGRILILSSATALPEVSGKFLSAHVDSATLLGGQSALSAGVEKAACGALQ